MIITFAVQVYKRLRAQGYRPSEALAEARMFKGTTMLRRGEKVCMPEQPK